MSIQCLECWREGKDPEDCPDEHLLSEDEIIAWDLFASTIAGKLVTRSADVDLFVFDVCEYADAILDARRHRFQLGGPKATQ